MSFFSELKRRNVFRAGAAYLVIAWLLIQVTETIFPLFGFGDAPARTIVIVLAIGFIPMAIFSWLYELTADGLRKETDIGLDQSISKVSGRKFDFVIIGLLAVALLMVGGNWYAGGDARWAHDKAFPEIEAYVAEGNYEAAYRLAKEVEDRLPDDSEMALLWGEFSWITSIPSVPMGATVFRRPYAVTDTKWEELGETPLNDIHLPFGLSLIRLELDNRPAVLRMLGGEGVGKVLRFVERRRHRSFVQFFTEPFVIDSAESLPKGMVRVPGWNDEVAGEAIEIRDFFIGRYEVTNREFKQFVDAGGYKNRDLWVHEFASGGDVISWEEAMRFMVDKSGRPGPGTWEGGNYPDGQENYPVAGVSWYEAVAYAQFAGFELPTYEHWRRAIADGALPWLLPASNLDGNGTSPVGEYQGIGWTGTYDMAGNVREWCWNASGENKVILGGGWNDAHYVVHESILDASNLPAFDRSPTNGFRLAKTSDESANAQSLRDDLPPAEKMFVGRPVSDDVYTAFRNNFDYDPAPLNAIVEATEKVGPWTREFVTFDASYGSERVGLYLYLPDNKNSRHQAVFWWGGMGMQFVESIDTFRTPLDFVLKNGRAVAVPVLKGTFSRRVSEPVSWETLAGRDLAIQQVKDMRRVIDYLETRPDIDADAIAYFGFSWGGRLGAIALAVEERLKVGILDQTGLQHLEVPEINVVNYLPRVKVPVLQFNGIYDTDFRFETSAKPFFELLGTEKADKKHVYDATGHFVPRPVVIGETLDWLDKYLGPPDQ